MACVETFYHGDFEKQDIVVNRELSLYKNRSGSFGRPLALKGCENKDDNFDPGNWWSIYGCGAPTLQKLATRILSLTSSSSGCERNWSSFGGIHTKKRNRLDVNRLNSLVFVQFNAKLFNKHKKVKDKNADVIFDDGNEDTVEDWLVGHGVEDTDSDLPLLIATQAPRVRDLYDDDFESEEEEEDVVDMEFEPDIYQDIPIFHDSQQPT